MSIRFKKGLAAVLCFVLVVATAFTGNWITGKAAATGNVPVNVIPHIENADGKHFNLDWEVYDQNGTKQPEKSGSINFNNVGKLSIIIFYLLCDYYI